MSDIQDEAYIVEKDAEIERLKRINVSLVAQERGFREEIERLKDEFQKASEWNQFSEIQIKNLQNIVEAQSNLLIRAADALYWHDGTTPYDLIAELRKVAQ